MSEAPAGQVEHTTAQVNIKAESGRVCVTINQDGRFISQMRLTPQHTIPDLFRKWFAALGPRTRSRMDRHPAGTLAV